LVAEADGEIAGYVMILTKVRSEDLEDGDVEYGLVADLVILEKFRKMGFGKKLLEAAEAHAMSNGVRWLRVGVLAGNPAAMNLYFAMGFSDSYMELEKDLMTSN
jgi:ribosomal protein S18 acetylase RimI-like enzyme